MGLELHHATRHTYIHTKIYIYIYIYIYIHIYRGWNATANVWARWLHNPCRLGDPHRLRAGGRIRKGPTSGQGGYITPLGAFGAGAPSAPVGSLGSYL